MAQGHRVWHLCKVTCLPGAAISYGTDPAGHLGYCRAPSRASPTERQHLLSVLRVHGARCRSVPTPLCLSAAVLMCNLLILVPFSQSSLCCLRLRLHCLLYPILVFNPVSLNLTGLFRLFQSSSRQAVCRSPSWRGGYHTDYHEVTLRKTSP